MARKPRKIKTSSKVKSANKKDQGPQLITYNHNEKRLNNPPVGLVNARSDGIEVKQRWAYDPHIDPALQFDTGRAQIEQLIDEVLASKDPEQYRWIVHQFNKFLASISAIGPIALILENKAVNTSRAA